jgi:hypothetical protein
MPGGKLSAMAMPDYPAEWRRALELLATSADGCTTALLVAHGLADSTITGLIGTGLVVATTKRVLADQRTVDVTRFRITNAGRLALER